MAFKMPGVVLNIKITKVSIIIVLGSALVLSHCAFKKPPLRDSDDLIWELQV